MDNKGYTLVELLATIAILGILSGVAIMGVSRYLNDSKELAYENIESSSYDAAVGYVINHNIMLYVGDTEGEKVSLKTLVEEGYLETPIDPNMKDSNCAVNEDESYVRIVNEGSPDSDALDEYSYYVHVVCPSGYRSSGEQGVKYPKE